MMKTLAAVVIFTVIFASCPALGDGPQKSATAAVNPSCEHCTLSNEVSWRLLLTFNVSESDYLCACEFDGSYIYTCEFNGQNFFKYDPLNGSLLETFTIPGVSNIIDLTSDGQYMYGGTGGCTIYQMDFTNHTLVGVISVPVSVMAIAYDSDLDGFWVTHWNSDIYCVGRDGSILQTIPCPGLSGIIGLAYYPYDFDPALWIFDQGDGNHQVIYELDIVTGQLLCNHDVNSDLNNGGIAGDLFFTIFYPSALGVLGGLSQAYPDEIFLYHIWYCPPMPYVTIPEGPTKGYIGREYSFNTTAGYGEEEGCYVKFDWGDGNSTDWIGPYPSGSNWSANHSWVSPGVYGVRAKMKTSFCELPWTDPHSITIEAGLKILSISPKKGKISVTIANECGMNLSKVNWSIIFSGGVILGKETTGKILYLADGATALVSSHFVLGLGESRLTVNVSTPETFTTKELNVWIFLFIFLFD